MRDINIEEILAKYYSGDKKEDFFLQPDAAKLAIKEIVELVMDKCAEEAEAIIYNRPYDYDDYAKVDKPSIFNVKTMVKYE